jgi:hypothetical protein
MKEEGAKLMIIEIFSFIRSYPISHTVKLFDLLIHFHVAAPETIGKWEVETGNLRVNNVQKRDVVSA